VSAKVCSLLRVSDISLDTMSLEQSADSSLAEQLQALHDTAPQRYSLLERYAEDLRQALEQSARNYASAKQLYSIWDDPPFEPQLFGQILSTAAGLEILRVYTHRSNHNRYDLTAYDSARMDQLVLLLADETASAINVESID
jgi:hypothetical protein